VSFILVLKEFYDFRLAFYEKRKVRFHLIIEWHIFFGLFDIRFSNCQYAAKASGNGWPRLENGIEQT